MTLKSIKAKILKSKKRRQAKTDRTRNRQQAKIKKSPGLKPQPKDRCVVYQISKTGYSEFQKVEIAYNLNAVKITQADGSEIFFRNPVRFNPGKMASLRIVGRTF